MARKRSRIGSPIFLNDFKFDFGRDVYLIEFKRRRVGYCHLSLWVWEICGYRLSQVAARPPALRVQAAALSSLSAPRMTILSASSGNGRCNALASSHGARIHTSRLVRGEDHRHCLGWIGSTTAFGDAVRKP